MRFRVVAAAFSLILVPMMCSHAFAGVDEALLLQSIYDKDAKKAKDLIEKGVDVNSPDKVTGATPLIAASLRGDASLVKLLLEKGADVTAHTKFGVTAVMAASLDPKNEEVIKLLFDQGAGIDLILQSAGQGDLDAVKALVELGVKVNQAHKATGDTPLMYAALSGNKDLVAYLLEQGADVNAKSARGATALMGASLDDNRMEIAKLLIEKGADVNAKTDSGKTAVQFSAFADEIFFPLKGSMTKSIGGKGGFENAMSRLLKESGAKE
jgi:ankyrin repeat protein